ncbi:MAG: hypothetical protein ACI8PZ_000884 [Myxococcota bacterium]|jgi:hypothetical protein
MPNTPADAVHVTGHCYCGGIAYAVHIPEGAAPIFTAYCHCDSCRRAHAAPLYHVACVDESTFTLTRGADLLVEFHKPGGSITRAFCGRCGSRMLNRFGSWKPGGRVPVAFFPNTLDEAIQHDLPDALRPQKQNRPGECVLDLEMLRPLLGEG